MAEADNFDRCRLGLDPIVDQVRPLEHRFAKLLTDSSARVFIDRVAVRVAERIEGGPDAVFPCEGVVHRVPSDVPHLGAYLFFDLGRDDDG